MTKNPSNPYQIEYVMKGGTFLSHESYCASFRISAKMFMFRTTTTEILKKEKE